MQRWRGLEATPADLGRTVVTIGMYDGVHRGHQQLIGAAVARAQAMRRPCLLLTFDPHPAEVVRPGSHPAILTSLDRKAELVAGLGVDAMCVLPFTAEFMRLPPETFTHTVLVEHLHAAQVVVGENFTYGHRAAGTVATLTAEGRRFGFAVEGVPLAEDSSDSGDVTISSTYIRACVAAGRHGRPPPGRSGARTAWTASSSAGTAGAGTWATRRRTWRARRSPRSPPTASTPGTW